MRNLRSKKFLSLLGAPFGIGQKLSGVELGPQILRKNGLVKLIEDNGYTVKDHGDINFPNHAEIQKIKSPLEKIKIVGQYTQKLSEKVSSIYCDEGFTLMLGGDHSTAIGSITGIMKKTPGLGVVWIDAHADINTIKGSRTKNSHGMPLSHLLKLNKKVPKAYEWLKNYPSLLPKNLVYIGLRDVDTAEIRTIKENNITAFFLGKNKLDPQECAEKTLSALEKCNDIHVSFDIDSLDKDMAPSTGTPAKNGLTLNDAKIICEELTNSGKIKTMDLVEINPKIGDEKDVKKTVEAALKIVSVATQLPD